MSVNDLHRCTVAGVDYWLRSPNVYDPAKVRRVLARQRVRRPALHEFQVSALAGIAALAALAQEPAEGLRQREIVEEWYRLLPSLNEDDIDEPDFAARAASLARLEAVRSAEMQRLYPQVSAIEANLERHWQSYADLLADKNYWDDVSRIEVVRLLLVKIGEARVETGDDRLLTEAAYQAIPPSHRMALASFAFTLLAPDETQRKN